MTVDGNSIVLDACPVPWCRGKAKFTGENEPYFTQQPNARVACTVCKFETAAFENYGEAAKVWNTRHKIENKADEMTNFEILTLAAHARQSLARLQEFITFQNQSAFSIVDKDLHGILADPIFQIEKNNLLTELRSDDSKDQSVDLAGLYSKPAKQK